MPREEKKGSDGRRSGRLIYRDAGAAPRAPETLAQVGMELSGVSTSPEYPVGQ